MVLFEQRLGVSPVDILGKGIPEDGMASAQALGQELARTLVSDGWRERQMIGEGHAAVRPLALTQSILWATAEE